MNNEDFMSIITSSWDRMTGLLFKQFSFAKWLTLSFALFLIYLGDTIGLIANWLSYLPYWEKFVIHFFLEEFHWTPVIAVLILLIIISIIILWISSRGTFIYLDKLLRPESSIVSAWKNYSARGNSLFLWRPGFSMISMICFAVIIAIGGIFMLSWIKSCIHANEILSPDFLAWLGIIFSLTVSPVVMLILILFNIVFMSFGTAMMYKDDIKSFAAAVMVFRMIKSRPMLVIEYLFVKLIFSTVIAFALLTAYILTCCILYSIALIPFLNVMVIHLPIETLLRFFDLGYLAKFGERYDLLTRT